MAESRGWRRLPKEQQLELHKSKDRVCYGALRNTAVFTYHKNPVGSIGFFEVFVAESARIPQTGPIFFIDYSLLGLSCRDSCCFSPLPVRRRRPRSNCCCSLPADRKARKPSRGWRPDPELSRLRACGHSPKFRDFPPSQHPSGRVGRPRIWMPRSTAWILPFLPRSLRPVSHRGCRPFGNPARMACRWANRADESNSAS
jgi:hypothetical protein